jgi:hypothetical protein
MAALPSPDADDIFSPEIWIQRLRQLSSMQMTGISIRVGEHHLDPDTLAAQTFLDALLSYHQGFSPECSMVLCCFNYDELAIGDKLAHMYVLFFSVFYRKLSLDPSGASVGAGPFRSIYERALSLFTKDASVWKPSRNGTFTWNVRTIPTNPLRLAKARTAGTLLALGYTWFARSFHPISFWLSALCVTPSPDSLKCTDFIGKIDEELANSLQAWPLDANIPLISSPSLTILLANHLNTTVSLQILILSRILYIYFSILRFRTVAQKNVFSILMSSLCRLFSSPLPILFEPTKSYRP